MTTVFHDNIARKIVKIPVAFRDKIGYYKDYLQLNPINFYPLFLIQMIIRLISILLSMYCLLCLFIIDELRNIEFFLINFQCCLEVVGNFVEFLLNYSESATGFFKWNCNYDRIMYYDDPLFGDIFDNSGRDYYYYGQRLVQKKKKTSNKNGVTN